MSPAHDARPPKSSTVTRFIPVVCGLIGACLVVGSLWAGFGVFSHWDEIAGLMGHLAYWAVANGVLKLISGVLLCVRSRWVLVAMPIWVISFIGFFLWNNRWDQIPPAFFGMVMVQMALFSFVLWVHGCGRLR